MLKLLITLPIWMAHKALQELTCCNEVILWVSIDADRPGTQRVRQDVDHGERTTHDAKAQPSHCTQNTPTTW